MSRKKIKLVLAVILTLAPLNLISAVPPEGVNSALVMAQKPLPALIDLDVKDVDIREIARIFARVSGLNFVVGEDVRASVTFKGSNVDWESALNMILKTSNLTYSREGNFLRILTYNKLQQEEDNIPLENQVVFLNFAKAGDISTALNALKSNRGTINPDLKTNSLVIKDTPDRIAKILQVVNELDKRTPQVMIEAMMVDVKLSDEDQLGIHWELYDAYRQSKKSMTQSLDLADSMGQISYGKTILPRYDFTALIDMFVENKKAEILANPKILALDSLPAKIELTSELPYTQSTVNPSAGGTTSTYSFRELGIKLEVIPHISSGGFVSLEIKTEQSYQTGETKDHQPTVDKRSAETNLLVANGETIVIGGLKKKEDTLTIDRLPILSDLPVVGKFFKSRAHTVADTELLIFISPSIVTEDKMSAQEQKSLDKLNDFRGTREKRIGYNNTPFPLRAPAK